VILTLVTTIWHHILWGKQSYPPQCDIFIMLKNLNLSIKTTTLTQIINSRVLHNPVLTYYKLIKHRIIYYTCNNK